MSVEARGPTQRHCSKTALSNDCMEPASYVHCLPTYIATVKALLLTSHRSVNIEVHALLLFDSQ